MIMEWIVGMMASSAPQNGLNTFVPTTIQVYVRAEVYFNHIVDHFKGKPKDIEDLQTNYNNIQLPEVVIHTWS